MRISLRQTQKCRFKFLNSRVFLSNFSANHRKFYDVCGFARDVNAKDINAKRSHRNVFERIWGQIYPASKAPQINANFIGLKPRFYRDLSQLGLKVAALNKLIFFCG